MKIKKPSDLPNKIFSKLVLESNNSNNFDSFSAVKPRRNIFAEIKIVKIKIKTILNLVINFFSISLFTVEKRLKLSSDVLFISLLT
jgi:hypothetical protein